MGDRVFLKMSPVRFWMWSLSGAQEGHDCCLTCLGIQHAEEAFVDGSCSSSGDMTISESHNRLRDVKHASAVIWHSSRQPGRRCVQWRKKKSRGDLRITVRASPSGVPHLSSTPQPAGVTLDRAGTSAEWGTPPVSFGAPPDDRMSIAALELSLSGDDDSAALPVSGVVTLSESDPEMTAMLSRAAENVGLVWNPPWDIYIYIYILYVKNSIKTKKILV